MKAAFLSGWLAAAVLVPAALAQQMKQFDCRQACTSLARLLGKPVSRETVEIHLRFVLERVFAAGQLGKIGPMGMLLSGTADDMELMMGILEQLQRADLQELRVQCTLVTMPVAAATAVGLVAGEPLVVDEAKGGTILKKAVAAKGTLRNLPESGVLPATVAILATPPAKPSPETAPDPFATLRVRVEALLVAEDEGWFALQFLNGEQRYDRMVPREGALADAQLRLKPGQGAMLMAFAGEQATVLWVRFVGTRKAEPPKPATEEKAK